MGNSLRSVPVVQSPLKNALRFATRCRKKKERTGAFSEVSSQSDATQAIPTFSREGLGAVLSIAKLAFFPDL